MPTYSPNPALEVLSIINTEFFNIIFVVINY